MTSKILLISILSLFLIGCAGNPPKMERPVKFYSGSPARQSMCRRTKAALTAWVKTIAQHAATKHFAPEVIDEALAPDAEECIKADAKEFGTLTGIPVDDLRVLLQYQENLLYKCAKWNQ